MNDPVALRLHARPRRLRWFHLALLLVLSTGSGWTAPEVAMKRALTASREARDAGWQLSDFAAHGMLKPGEHAVLRFTFLSSMTYRVMVAGCDQTTEIDAALFDERGQLVVQDTKTGPLAVVEKKPLWTGTYFLKITIRRAGAAGGHYSVQYAYD